MKNLTLSKEFNFKIEDILSIANYSLSSINFLHNYNPESPKSIYEIVTELTSKVIVGGLVNIEILDLKLAAQHYLAGAISEQEFLSLAKSCSNNPIDISILISSLKDDDSIGIKNISQSNYMSVLTIERFKLS